MLDVLYHIVYLGLHFLTLIKQRAVTRNVREKYKETDDIDFALRQLPRYLVAERAIVSLFSPFMLRTSVNDFIVRFLFPFN